MNICGLKWVNVFNFVGVDQLYIGYYIDNLIIVVTKYKQSPLLHSKSGLDFDSEIYILLCICLVNSIIFALIIRHMISIIMMNNIFLVSSCVYECAII